MVIDETIIKTNVGPSASGVLKVSSELYTVIDHHTGGIAKSLLKHSDENGLSLTEVMNPAATKSY